MKKLKHRSRLEKSLASLERKNTMEKYYLSSDIDGFYHLCLEGTGETLLTIHTDSLGELSGTELLEYMIQRYEAETMDD